MAWWVEAGLDSGLCLSPTLGTCVQYTNCPSVCRTPGNMLLVSSVPCHWIFLSTAVLWGKYNSAGQMKRLRFRVVTFQGDVVSRRRSNVQMGVLWLQIQRLAKYKAEWSNGVPCRKGKEIQESLGRTCQVWQLLLGWSSCFDGAASLVSDGCGPPSELQRRRSSRQTETTVWWA